MSVLLLRLTAPMQSWGIQSRFSVRDTGLEPSKSGVIGLLCAAQGRRRQEPLGDLAGLVMGVRVDHEGRLSRDYHTALDVIKADGSKPGTVVSQRYYLACADFLVGLEGPQDLLARVADDLAKPKWPLYLGRKAFVPGEPVHLGDGLQSDADLSQALKAYPWRSRQYEKLPESLRLVMECKPGQGEPRPDVPVSFSERRFTVRHVRTDWLPMQEVICS